MKTNGRFAELKNEVWFVTLALGFAVPGLQAWGDQSVLLAWDASPTIEVVGYVVHYGGESRVYTNSLDVGDTNSATVGGLQDGATYFIAVTAYDRIGLSSAPSDEIQYQVPSPVPNTGPDVQLTMGTQAGPAAQTRLIRFQAFPDKNYELQVTEDFQSWTTIWNSSPVTTIQWLEFQDSDTTASGIRFYRLVVH